MAGHTIEIADFMRGGEPHRIVWNDETGTVEGDHSDILFIRSMIKSAPIETGDGGRTWRLEDPGRNPAEFLVLLYLIDWRILHQENLRETLPAIFEGVELPPGEKAEDLYDSDPETGEPVLVG